MNRGYLGRHFHCFYPFYARLFQILSRYLQNEYVISSPLPVEDKGEGENPTISHLNNRIPCSPVFLQIPFRL
jgi:hypothetical protein